jgi:hypothetical protein
VSVINYKIIVTNFLIKILSIENHLIVFGFEFYQLRYATKLLGHKLLEILINGLLVEVRISLVSGHYEINYLKFGL